MWRESEKRRKERRHSPSNADENNDRERESGKNMNEGRVGKGGMDEGRERGREERGLPCLPEQQWVAVRRRISW